MVPFISARYAAAMLNAEDSILIVGWDLDSRVRLVGPSGMCDDGLPETFAAFLSALVQRRPKLRIRLLLWDYSMVFSLRRELAADVLFPLEGRHRRSRSASMTSCPSVPVIIRSWW